MLRSVLGGGGGGGDENFQIFKSPTLPNLRFETSYVTNIIVALKIPQ